MLTVKQFDKCLEPLIVKGDFRQIEQAMGRLWAVWSVKVFEAQQPAFHKDAVALAKGTQKVADGGDHPV